MSTRSSSFPSVPFSISHPQQSLRLLELPPDLLELLTSDNRPATLLLKSGLPSNSGSSKGTKTKDEYLHLCTKDRVWAIRQVSTSNSVYITTPKAPSDRPSPSDGDAMEIDQLSDARPAITAICQPTSSLELIPLNITQVDVEAAIRSLLPIHPLSTNDEDPSLIPSPTSTTYSISTLISNLPYPSHILLPTLRTLFVFESRTPIKASSHPPGEITAFIPTPSLLLQSWKHFYNTFLTTQPRGADLSIFDVLGAGEITTAIAVDEGEVYACVVNAIMERFVQLDIDDGEDEEQQREEYSLEGPLKGEELSVWLGQLIVRCAGVEGVEEEKLVDEWTGLLPRAWAGYCAVERLGEECVVEDGRVRWVEAQRSKTSTEDSADGSKTGAAPTGKRKWHEKFAKERNNR